jgi:hypothetical protein
MRSAPGPGPSIAAFALGRHRPEGTLCEAAPSVSGPLADDARPRLSITSERHCEIELRKVEGLLHKGHADVAYRRARALHEAEVELPGLLLARIQFALATACVALADGDRAGPPRSGTADRDAEKHTRSRLAQAERAFAACAMTLESQCGGPSEPSLVPCLLNRGVALSRLGRFRAAVEVLQAARAVCGGLLGGGAAILRGRVLLALAAATLGRGGSTAPAEAESLYREALATADAEERSVHGWSVNVLEHWQAHAQPPFVRRPQPARAALAALLQARGQHREALSLLCIQRKGLREAVARHGGEAEGGWYADGAGGGNVAAELAYTCGRLALSAFAVRREGLAMASLREAARLRLIGTGGMGDGAAAADGGGRDGGSSVASVEALERWIEHAQTLPIDLARALGSKQSPGWTGSVSSRRAAAAAATPASGENACGGGGHDHSRIPLCV